MLKCYQVGPGISLAEVYQNKVPTAIPVLTRNGKSCLFLFCLYLHARPQESNVLQLQFPKKQTNPEKQAETVCVITTVEFNNLPWLTDRSHVISIAPKTSFHSSCVAGGFRVFSGPESNSLQTLLIKLIYMLYPLLILQAQNCIQTDPDHVGYHLFIL